MAEWTPEQQAAVDAGRQIDTTKSDAQWAAWSKHYNPANGTWSSSKVDQNGNPIQGPVEHPDACPQGMAAFGLNQCRPEGALAGGGGGGGGGIGGGYSGGGGGAGPQYNFKDAPAFNAPQFTAPSFENLVNDPGYQFRLKQGQGALQASAAAKGVLHTGGTLKDILGYGQDLASQEYGNAFNRALQGYGANYQAAKDSYAPQFAQWQNQFGAEQGRGNLAYGREWDTYALSNQNQQNQKDRQTQLLPYLIPTAPQYPSYGG